MTDDPFRFFHRLRVRWAECDPQGIVFNPHYMMYVDVGVTEYFRAIGLPYPDAFLADGTDTFMVACAVNFRDAARFDDLIDVGLRVEQFGRTSFGMAFSLRRDGQVLTEGTLTYVNGHRETRHPAPLPERLVSAVMEFETVTPATGSKRP